MVSRIHVTPHISDFRVQQMVALSSTAQEGCHQLNCDETTTFQFLFFSSLGSQFLERN